MWDWRLAISCAAKGIVAGVLSLVVASAANLLLLIVFRQFVEGEEVFGVLLLGVFLFGLSAVGAFVFGVYVGSTSYWETRARAELREGSD